MELMNSDVFHAKIKGSKGNQMYHTRIMSISRIPVIVRARVLPTGLVGRFSNPGKVTHAEQIKG